MCIETDRISIGRYSEEVHRVCTVHTKGTQLVRERVVGGGCSLHRSDTVVTLVCQGKGRWPRERAADGQANGIGWDGSETPDGCQAGATPTTNVQQSPIVY